ncbi:MAG: hypothetical protein Kow00109_09490 [Acidobacteriota bacterium]
MAVRTLFAWLIVFSPAVLAQGSSAQPAVQEAVEARFTAGVDALRQGDAAAAARIFEELRRADPNNPLVLHNLGIAYQALARHEEAIAAFAKALELAPEQRGTRALLGTELLRAGRPTEAVEHLEAARREDPNNPLIAENLAEAYQRVGRLPEAVAEYQRVARARPEDARVAYRLGRLYLELANWALERLGEVAPDSARLHQAAGDNALARGDLEAAETALRAAVERAPKQPDLHLALATVLLRRGRLTEALAEVERELELVPYNRGALLLREQLRARLARDGGTPGSPEPPSRP